MNGIYVRASIGTLALLGLVEEFKVEEPPTTAYVLQHSPKGCRARCLFCMQSSSLYHFHDGLRLGRVKWPVVKLEEVLGRWRRVFHRFCLQTVIKPMFHREAVEIIKRFRWRDQETPVSLAVTPVPRDVLWEVKSLGVDALGVGLDASVKELFYKWGKPYSWDTYLKFIEKAVGVFGRGNVYVHIVVGLGEEPSDIVSLMRHVYGIGGRVALFSYVDQRNRSPVKIENYRLVQLARYMLELGHDPREFIDFEKRRLIRMVDEDFYEAFLTSGCPGCNRPFYNESPSGTLYNISSVRMLARYREKLRDELAKIGGLD